MVNLFKLQRNPSVSEGNKACHRGFRRLLTYATPRLTTRSGVTSTNTAPQLSANDEAQQQGQLTVVTLWTADFFVHSAEAPRVSAVYIEPHVVAGSLLSPNTFSSWTSSSTTRPRVTCPTTTTTMTAGQTQKRILDMALAFLLSCLWICTVKAGSNGLAITPQMGWNTWNHFGCDISEDTILTAAQAFVDNNLTQYGYECGYIPSILLGETHGNGT